jgi:general secretion pathway protein D
MKIQAGVTVGASGLAALRRVFLAFVAATAVVSCASDQRAEPAAAPSARPAVEEAPQVTAQPGPESIPAAVDTREEIIERGTGGFIGPARGRGTGDSTPGDVDLRFDGADIREFVRAVLGDLLGVNYLIDTAVTGTVTLQTTRPIRQEELLPLFEQILAANNAVLVREGTLYQVVPRASAAKQADLVTGRDATAGVRTQVIPLRFIAASEMQRILQSVVADPSTLRIDTARNLVIVSGTAAEVQSVQDTIGIFDVDWLRGMSLGLYPLDNVDPTTLEAELTRVLSATAGQDDGGPLGGIVRLVPLERLTSLLVVSSTPAGLREVEVWIRRLDQPGESAGKRLYVYPVQNAKATELADILGNIFQSRASTRADATPSAAGSPTSNRMGGVAPGLTPVQIGPRPIGPGGVPTPVVATPAAPESGDGLALVDGGSLEIIADDVRNALVILATPEQYRMVESAVRKLDIVPLQVLIEARILEVALRDDLSYGVEWFFHNNNIDGGEGRSRGTLDLGDAGIAGLAPGFAYTIIDTADNVRFALNLLAEESDVNVLSAPSLMVLDNQTATINVGDEIPVPARQSISNIDPNSPTVNEITFRQTGITLSVTPRVSNSGLVTMEVQQEVATAAATTTSNIDAPTIQNRQIDSVVAVNSGETIVLGGLMRTQQTESETGVPGLRRIPGLGKLFGATNNEEARTELLVLITPRVIRNRDDVRSITEEFRQKLPRLQQLEAEIEPKS